MLNASQDNSLCQYKLIWQQTQKLFFTTFTNIYFACQQFLVQGIFMFLKHVKLPTWNRFKEFYNTGFFFYIAVYIKPFQLLCEKFVYKSTPNFKNVWDVNKNHKASTWPSMIHTLYDCDTFEDWYKTFPQLWKPFYFLTSADEGLVSLLIPL